MLKALASLFVLLSTANLVLADEAPSDKSKDAKPAATQFDRDALFEHFEKTLSGVKLVGRFTVLGKEKDSLPKEEYTIESVEKLPDGDLWLFKVRIKYGKKDVKLPLPLEVKWAGTTPIITLTDVTIPGMGTFSSRVVIYNGKYAGTWQHGDVGGHLFGTIERLSEAPGEEAKQE